GQLPVTTANGMIVGHSSKNDVSPPLRSIKPIPMMPVPAEREAAENPRVPLGMHRDAPDTVVQHTFGVLAMPTPSLTFEGIDFPGVACNCAPPDTDGEVGSTQYVQMVNKGYQVWDKTSGATLLGPVDIATLWSGFGGVCQN